jgi:basic membrane protein A and related proteins
MALTTGQILNNRYRIVKILGEGGFGAVYRAWDMVLERPCALKENLQITPDAQRQFRREALILAGLAHPNLPRVIDHFLILGQGQYLVMDYVDGEDLQTKMDRAGRLPEAQVLPWIVQICAALEYMHNQPSPVIHRDIKPGNIRIRQDGRAMLVDFGIAKVFDPHIATTVGAKAITAGYSPPEQYSLGAPTDTRSDIYSLGATLYSLLTGFVPPDSIDLLTGTAQPLPAAKDLARAVSAQTSAAIEKAMALARDQRWQTVAEFEAALLPGLQVQVQGPASTSSFTSTPPSGPPVAGQPPSSPAGPLVAGQPPSSPVGPLVTGQPPSSPAPPMASVQPTPPAAPSQPAFSAPPASSSTPHAQTLPGENPPAPLPLQERGWGSGPNPAGTPPQGNPPGAAAAIASSPRSAPPQNQPTPGVTSREARPVRSGGASSPRRAGLLAVALFIVLLAGLLCAGGAWVYFSDPFGLFVTGRTLAEQNPVAPAAPVHPARSEPPSPAPAAPDFNACLLPDGAGIDDHSYNAATWGGVQAAVDKFGIQARFLESQQTADYEKNIGIFIDEHCNLIIGVGFLLGDAIKTAAQQNPGTYFSIVDFSYDPPLPNVAAQVYASDQAAFLAGYLAAGMSSSGKVGVFGGQQIPPVTLYMDGFALGVQAYNQRHGTQVEVLGWDPAAQSGLFTGNFDSQEDGRAMSNRLMDEGADIIFPVAGQVGLGAGAAIRQRGNALLIGVDTDWYAFTPEYRAILLTSALKRTDVLTFNIIQAALDGRFKGGEILGSLENNGVGLAPFHDLDGRVPQTLKDELEQIKQEIIAGSLRTHP